MRISRIRIQNSRSIQSLDFPIGNICALIGPHIAGKSNILLALHHLLGRDWVISPSPQWDNLRADPRFNDCLGRMKLRPV